MLVFGMLLVKKSNEKIDMTDLRKVNKRVYKC